jgi:hypothetical protein
MKINEIVSSGIVTEGKLRKAARLALPDARTWPDLDNNNSPYAAYRFGVALATSPNQIADKEGPIRGQFTTIGYSSADNEILSSAAKQMGVKSKKLSGKGSKELPFINKSSPTAKPKKNKYGV